MDTITGLEEQSHHDGIFPPASPSVIVLLLSTISSPQPQPRRRRDRLLARRQTLLSKQNPLLLGRPQKSRKTRAKVADKKGLFNRLRNFLRDSLSAVNFAASSLGPPCLLCFDPGLRWLDARLSSSPRLFLFSYCQTQTKSRAVIDQVGA